MPQNQDAPVSDEPESKEIKDNDQDSEVSEYDDISDSAATSESDASDSDFEVGNNHIIMTTRRKTRHSMLQGELIESKQEQNDLQLSSNSDVNKNNDNSEVNAREKIVIDTNSPSKESNISSDGSNSSDAWQTYACERLTCDDSTGFFICFKCKTSKCGTHLLLELKQLCPETDDFQLSEQQIQTMNQENGKFICLECLNLICQTIDIHSDFITKFQMYNYLNEDSYNNLDAIKSDSDRQWRILCVDELFNDFKKYNYDVERWLRMSKPGPYMSKYEKEFEKYLKYWQNKLKGTLYERFVSYDNTRIIAEAKYLKKFAMEQIAKHKTDLMSIETKLRATRNDKVKILKRNSYGKQLAAINDNVFNAVNNELKSRRYDCLRFYYKIQHSKIYLESGIEGLGSKASMFLYVIVFCLQLQLVTQNIQSTAF